MSKAESLGGEMADPEAELRGGGAPAGAEITITAVVPAYRVEREIRDVLQRMPGFVTHIVVVDDASPDQGYRVVEDCAARDRRIHLVRHQVNSGVGGAMITGFRKALELNSDIVVKVDGDGQMCASDMPRLLQPLLSGAADYAKGHRFRDFHALRQMPLVRRVGNLALSFLAKAATGYWNCFDPNNGYVAIRGEVLQALPLGDIDKTYFFETSMLHELNLIDAVVQDVSMPARYGDEVSNLSIKKVLLQFPRKMFKCLLRRVFLKNFIFDFNVMSLFLVFGLMLFCSGAGYGGYQWWAYASRGVGAPAGTVVIPAMLIMLGFQLLLAAVAIDLQAVPRRPLNSGPLSLRKDRS